ncbi:MAG: polysulfide reductase NrfD [Chromatiales bacterium]|nr:polysulfide reductase NrfD [Chromatiales bacterium]
MVEELLITARANPKIDPSLGIWSWEIPVYLFFGGLTAGILFFSAWMILRNRDEETPFAASRYAIWAPIVLSIGMTTLFLDLEHKLYVFRFYTTLQPLSPMSWGSWVLLIIYPLAILLTLATLRKGYPMLAGLLEKLPFGSLALDLSERFKRPIAIWTIPFAIALGIYTGILLSAFSARPFWNSGVLGPLFLVSGLSSAAALAVLLAKQHGERLQFARIDLGLIAVELLLVGLLIINLHTGSGPQVQAVQQILGGPYTQLFWLGFVLVGLLIPLMLGWLEIRNLNPVVFLGPLLVLIGGYLLRQLTVDLGQVSTWTNYASQFNPQLLELLP